MVGLLTYTAAAAVSAGIISALTAPVIKFMKNKKIEETVWTQSKPEKITDLGTVKNLKVYP